MPTALFIWTIYKKGFQPFPDEHIARCFIVRGKKMKATRRSLYSSLEELRETFIRNGLVPLMPAAQDNEIIIELWMPIDS